MKRYSRYAIKVLMRAIERHSIIRPEESLDLIELAIAITGMGDAEEIRTSIIQMGYFLDEFQVRAVEDLVEQWAERYSPSEGEEHFAYFNGEPGIGVEMYRAMKSNWIEEEVAIQQAERGDTVESPAIQRTKEGKRLEEMFKRAEKSIEDATDYSERRALCDAGMLTLESEWQDRWRWDSI